MWNAFQVTLGTGLIVAGFAALTSGCDGGGTTTPAGDAPSGDSQPGGDPAPGDNAPRGDARIVATSCAEISAADCFANHECPPAERCQSVSATPGDVVCCVTGPRGTAAAGTACGAVNGELFCDSGICIDNGTVSLCSKTCTAIADCPLGMKRCMAIAFSGSADDWCFPE